MTLDQVLLAVFVIVTVANIALVVVAARGGSLAGRLRTSRPAPKPQRSASGPYSAAASAPNPSTAAPAVSFRPVAEPPRGNPADALPPDLAELLARPAPIAPFGGHESGPGRDERSAYDGRDGRERTERPERPDRPDRRDPRDVRDPVEADQSVRDVAPKAPPAGASRMLMELASNGPRLTLDAATSLENAAGWSRIMEIENARLLRYRRPVTVVMAEIEGVRKLADRVGEEAVERLLPVVADAFRKEARGSDWIARIGEYRFAILMPETDEIQAINYVERVRLCCEPWLGSAAVPLRLAMGWASPPASGDLEFAVLRAEERMNSDRRVVGKPMLPMRSFGPRVVSLPARPVEEPPDEPIEDVALDLPGARGATSSGFAPEAGPARGGGEGHAPTPDSGPKARRHTRRDRGDGTGPRE